MTKVIFLFWLRIKHFFFEIEINNKMSKSNILYYSSLLLIVLKNFENHENYEILLNGNK